MADALRDAASCGVVASVYESRPGDIALPEHTDAWLNIVVQLEGRKKWTFPGESATLQPGDVMLVPSGVAHSVATVSQSCHIGFGLFDDELVERYKKTSTSSPPTSS